MQSTEGSFKRGPFRHMRVTQGKQMRMLLGAAVLVLAAMSVKAGAQTTASNSGGNMPPPNAAGSQQPPEGVETGGYRIHQSIEVGYRVNDTSGSGEMYDTLVNLHTGARLLEQTISMQSTTQEGTVFDNLWVTSFG